MERHRAGNRPLLGSRALNWDKDTAARLAGPLLYAAEQEQIADQMFSSRRPNTLKFLSKLLLFPFQVSKGVFSVMINEWKAPDLQEMWYFRFYLVALVFLISISVLIFKFFKYIGYEQVHLRKINRHKTGNTLNCS